MGLDLLVTGAGGLLGQDLVRLALARGHRVAACTRADLDVTDAAAVKERLRRARAAAVVNCAAFTDVDGAESHEDEATRVNGAAAGNVARAAAAAGAVCVQVSTDYVFAGDGRTPLRETDAPAPRSAYGRSKLAGETEVQRAGGKWLVVRSAWLYGAGGRNFIDTIRAKAREAAPLRVVGDQTGSPTWSVSLANGLLDLIETGCTGLVHFANRGAVTWLDVARAVVEESGLAVPVLPISTQELGRPAPRPPFSALDVSLFEGVVGRAALGWREALRLYLGGAVDEPRQRG